MLDARFWIEVIIPHSIIASPESQKRDLGSQRRSGSHKGAPQSQRRAPESQTRVDALQKGVLNGITRTTFMLAQPARSSTFQGGGGRLRFGAWPLLCQKLCRRRFGLENFTIRAITGGMCTANTAKSQDARCDSKLGTRPMPRSIWNR